MKIKVYDEFKTFREFINICKGVWRFLKNNNCTIKNLTVYVTLYNENNNCEDINLYDKDGNISCKNVGLMIGDFPYINWDEFNENKKIDKGKKIIVRSEGDMLKQRDYNLNCNRVYYKGIDFDDLE
ncbi:MAG: hypothetical protein BWY47_02029 [Bacteroidetes bacterium ADurb.Bin302]|nr:MAG: hypothetical protein BWY47_02029 [Bacteroidetes bacterium ADurb.Bin302]